jgi:hypothetical protein
VFETQSPNAKRLLTLALGVGAVALLRRSMQSGNGHAYHDVDRGRYDDGYPSMPYRQPPDGAEWSYPGDHYTPSVSHLWHEPLGPQP